MITVRMRVLEFPNGQRDNQSRTVLLAPERIDTVTVVEDPEKHNLPGDVRSVIRYDCKFLGYRLFFVAELANEIGRARRVELRGEDSDGPRYDIDPMG